MKIGCSLPQSGPLASPENLVRVATRAEQLGYGSVWVFERLLWAASPRDPYPPSPDGRWPANFQNVFDPIETLTFVAAHTRTVRLGTSVLVLPYHQPVLWHDDWRRWMCCQADDWKSAAAWAGRATNLRHRACRSNGAAREPMNSWRR